MSPFSTLFFLLFLLFPLTGRADFPWPSEKGETDKTELYNLQIKTHAMNFFTEDYFRYFAGANLNIIHPVFEIKTTYDYSITEDYHYFRPSNLSLKFTVPNGQWIIGRKPIQWDWADQFWNRGLWQPSYADDTLRPQWAGLTGIFREFNYEEGQITLFGSGVFIPDSTPPFESKNGKLISDNPWFTAPPSSTNLEENTIKPFFIVKEELGLKDLLKFSLGAKASYKDFYIAYSYKPMNKIRVKSQFIMDGSKELKGNHKTGYEQRFPLAPVILQHHLLSGGLDLASTDSSSDELQNTNYRLKVSLTYNHPEIHDLQDVSEIFFQHQTELHSSVKGEIHVKDPLEETTLHVSYTHQFLLGDKRENTLEKVFPGIKQEFFRDDLFQFSRAASTGITHSIKFNKQYEAKIKARLIYHLLKEYFLFSFYSSLTFDNSFSIFISGDLIFSDFPFSFKQTKEDIGIYTNKSRIFGGLSYDF